MKIIRSWKNVRRPGSSTGHDLYLIDRGQGRECVHSCYVSSVLEERVNQGLLTVFAVPDSVEDNHLPFHPEVWCPTISEETIMEDKTYHPVAGVFAGECVLHDEKIGKIVLSTTRCALRWVPQKGFSS